MAEFVACWAGLDDPRTGNAELHDFHELLVIALCSVLCGGQGAVSMARFAEAKEGVLRAFLKLANCLPGHDTFSRLFRHLDPDQVSSVFQRFMERFSKGVAGVVAIDGKVVRRSFDRASGKSAMNMVSAWNCEQRLVLAQIATDAKSNEITAVPKLLAMLSLKGTIVTADALNCQCVIAKQIVDQNSDDVLALKGSQGRLHDDVVTFLDDPALEEAAPTSARTVDADHGRIETRTTTVLTDIAWLQADHRWPGLAAVGKIVRVRQCGPKTTTETAYYLFSTALCAERFNQVAREHWSVENRLHWRLDVVMNEDQDRTRLGNGPQNLAVLRHMALNVMQKDGSKESLRGNSKGQAETTLSSPACSGCFEMRLPWSCQRMRLPSWCHRLKPDGERISRAVQRVTSRQIKLARTDRSSHDPRHATTREAALCQTETSRARTRPDRRCRVSSGAGYAS